MQDLWTLSANEAGLLPGMTDKVRLGFEVQFKFMQIHGRFPERDEIDPNALRWVAMQLGFAVLSKNRADRGVADRWGKTIVASLY